MPPVVRKTLSYNLSGLITQSSSDTWTDSSSREMNYEELVEWIRRRVDVFGIIARLETQIFGFLTVRNGLLHRRDQRGG